MGVWWPEGQDEDQQVWSGQFCKHLGIRIHGMRKRIYAHGWVGACFWYLRSWASDKVSEDNQPLSSKFVMSMWVYRDKSTSTMGRGKGITHSSNMPLSLGEVDHSYHWKACAVFLSVPWVSSLPILSNDPLSLSMPSFLTASSRSVNYSKVGKAIVVKIQSSLSSQPFSFYWKALFVSKKMDSVSKILWKYFSFWLYNVFNDCYNALGNC